MGRAVLRRRGAVALLALGLGAAGGLASPVAGAAPAPAPEEIFVEAQQLFDQRAYADALPRFRAVHDATRSPNAQVYAARCLREMGRLTEAYEQYAAALADASSRAEAEPKYRETRDTAAAELAALEPQVGRVIVVVPDAVTVSEVTVGDRRLPAAALGRTIAVWPGRHRVTATRPAGTPFAATVDVAPGAQRTVAVLFGAPAVEPREQPPDGSSTADRRGSADAGLAPPTVAAIVAGAVGLLGMVSFAVTGSMTKARADRLEEECGSTACGDPSFQDVVDEGNTLQTIANVSLATGLVSLAAAGGLLLYGALTGDGEGDAEARPVVALGPSGGWLGVRLRFGSSRSLHRD